MGLVCGFQIHYWCTDSWDRCLKEKGTESVQYVFLHVLHVWVRDRLKLIKREEVMTLFTPHPSWVSTSGNTEPSLGRERKRKWPNSNRKCCKVTSSSVQGGVDAMLSCVACVCFVRTCVWQRSFGLAWPTSGTATALFQQFEQETAVESGAEVKVCTQPFEGYSVLLANINQMAWSWAFTEPENHSVLAHSHRIQHNVGTAGIYAATLMKVEFVKLWKVTGNSGLNEPPSV